MNVLVIPEDFRNDQYLLRPIIAALLSQVGKPHARVSILTDPALQGVDEATSRGVLAEVIDRYRGMVHLFLLIVDRDGQPSRDTAVERLEDWACNQLPRGRCFLGVCAREELETWAMAVIRPAGIAWKDVREHPHPKEAYFERVVSELGLAEYPGGGRSEIGRRIASSYNVIRSKCKEDARVLEDRVAEFVGTGICPPCAEPRRRSPRVEPVPSRGARVSKSATRRSKKRRSR